MRRTFKNLAGLSAEEYEKIADELMGPDEQGRVGAMLRNPILAKAVLKLLAPMSKEGSGAGGEGGQEPYKPPTPEDEIKKELPKTAAALGWS